MDSVQNDWNAAEVAREKLMSRAVQDATSGCVEWQGALNDKGYGVVWFAGKAFLAHRLLVFGPYDGDVLQGLCVCHVCDNPRCIKAEHLFVASHKENMRDARLKGRMAKKLGQVQVAAIRRDLLDGVPRKVLAAEYGVTPTTIYHIETRKTWPDVEPFVDELERVA